MAVVMKDILRVYMLVALKVVLMAQMMVEE